MEALKAAHAARHPSAHAKAIVSALPPKSGAKVAAKSSRAAPAAASAAAARKIKIGEDDAAAKHELDDYFKSLDEQVRPSGSSAVIVAVAADAAARARDRAGGGAESWGRRPSEPARQVPNSGGEGAAGLGLLQQRPHQVF